MKKALSLLLAGVMCVGLLAGCSGQDSGTDTTDDSTNTETTETGNKQIDTLRIAFVPSREPEEIITATEPLKQMLTDELAKLCCLLYTSLSLSGPPILTAACSRPSWTR